MLMCSNSFRVTFLFLQKVFLDVNIDFVRYLYAPNGTLIKAGETMKNPELAATLEIIANANDSDPFYGGQMADIMEEEVNAHGGILTVDDLKDYRAILRKPIRTKLGSYEVLNTPAPASGPVLAFILNILKGIVLLNGPYVYWLYVT